MKTTVDKIKAMIGGVILIMFIIGLAALGGTIETTYFLNGEVVAINGDEIIIKDLKDEEWSFIGEGFAKGDQVHIRFFTNGTDNTRYDDTVEAVRIISK